MPSRAATVAPPGSRIPFRRNGSFRLDSRRHESGHRRRELDNGLVSSVTIYLPNRARQPYYVGLPQDGSRKRIRCPEQRDENAEQMAGKDHLIVDLQKAKKALLR